MRKGPIGITVILVILLAVGFYVPPAKSVDANYLLAVVSTVGTLGGIAFALYGWYSAKELPNLIDKKVNERIEEIEKSLKERLYSQQEAVQKVIASYNVQDPDQKIALLQEALETDPTVYNGFVALGYVYWYEKGDLLAAEECFRKDLDYHPENYQAACDLVALYASQKEWLSSLRWMKEAIDRNPNTWEYFQTDTRLDELRKQKPDEYQKIIDDAKRRM